MTELVLFECKARSARLTTKGCAGQWTAAQERPPETWEGRWHCRSCPIGAENAGVAQPRHKDEALAKLCPRCGRLSDRMIGGRLCISCYNREGEVRRGKNRKGQPPVMIMSAIRTIVAIFTVNGIEDIREFENVTSVNEVLVLLLREHGRDAVVEVRETDAEGANYRPWSGSDVHVLGAAGRGLTKARPYQGRRKVIKKFVHRVPKSLVSAV